MIRKRLSLVPIENIYIPVVVIVGADENEQVGELVNQIENESVTQTDSIALDEDAGDGDVVIHQIEASGLSGLLESTGEDDAAAQVTQLLNESSTVNNDGINGDASVGLRIR